MKNLKIVASILLSVCIVTGFSACSKDIPQKTPGETQNNSSEQTSYENMQSSDEIVVLNLDKQYIVHNDWQDGYPQMLVNSEYSLVTLDEECAKKYPAIAKALNKQSTMQSNSMEDERDNFISFAKESWNTDAENFRTFVSSMDVFVRRADSIAVSMLEDYYSDGSRVLNSLNFDTQTGKFLSLSDVVTDASEIPAVVEKEIMSRIGQDEPYGETAVVDYFNNISQNDINWTLEYNGITFRFNPGDIAPTNFGVQTVTLTFAQYPDLFNKKYTVVPDAYIVSLPLMSSFFTDLTDDGRSEELVVSGDYDPDDEYYYTLSVDSGNSYYEVDWFAYNMQPYYVRTADGGNFLYVFSDLSKEEDRQMTLSVFSLNDGEIKQVCEKNIGLLYNNNSFAVPTSPDNLRLYDYDSNSPLLNFTIG